MHEEKPPKFQSFCALQKFFDSNKTQGKAGHQQDYLWFYEAEGKIKVKVNSKLEFSELLSFVSASLNIIQEEKKQNR